MEITKIKLSDIKPYEGNAKLHPEEQIAQIKESIREFGNNDPIAVDENNIIIEGHGRYIALKELGYEEAECIILRGMTEDQKNAYRLVHNKLTMNSGFDIEILEKELENISIDMGKYDFDLSGFEPEAEQDDFDVDGELDEIEEPTTKRGDLYKLGNHYLLCGDSTSKEDVERLMQGKKADLLLTDPPYNVAVSNSDGLTIENDNLSKAEFKKFIDSAMKRANESLKEGGAFYVFYGDIEDVAFRTACFENELTIHQCLIWVKNHFTLGRQDYQWRHEPCLYGWKDGAGHYFVDDRTQDTVIEDKLNINGMSKDELKELVKQLLDDRNSTTILREDKPTIDEDHPTMKPIKLLARLIKNSARKEEIVLDLFGGSGSTLIACEQLNRVCYMMEYDPKYCDVIVKRWETLTGRKAELL